MTLAQGIETLRNENFTDDEILENIRKIRPDLIKGIDTLTKEEFTTNDIIENISSIQLEPRKLGKAESVAAGLTEGVVAPLFLAEKAGKLVSVQKPDDVILPRDVEAQLISSKPIEEMSFAELAALSDDDILPPSTLRPSKAEEAVASPEAKDPIGTFLQNIPESEDEAARRLRVGASALPVSAFFGPSGIAAGLVGSQAGQTVRETLGEEGESQNIATEALAIAADILAGGVTQVGLDLTRSGIKASTSRIPAVFQETKDLAGKVSVRQTIQGENNALNKTVKAFGDNQLQAIESQAYEVSPFRFSELPETTTGTLNTTAEQAYREANLVTISPYDTTPEVGGLSLQRIAQETFDTNVVQAERAAYAEARAAAEGTSGQAPKTLKQARKLRADLIKTSPTPEQDPVIRFLNNLILELEETIPETTTPASTILNAEGEPFIKESVTPSRTIVRNREANDLVEMVQNGNNAINYDSQFREQSFRLKPIINTLRGEVDGVLSSNRGARTLYQRANALHGTNAETWGTKFMRKVRFTENPESIVSSSKTASNMRNFKEGVDNLNANQLLDRLVVDSLTEKGSAESNRIALRNLNPVLSPKAREASSNILKFKNPLTAPGGRIALNNAILKDVVESINTGVSPTKSLKLMQSVKGYESVRSSLSGTSEGRRIFRSMERLFLENLFDDIIDSSGSVDFKKATNILKNRETRAVVREIAGDRFVNSVHELENMSKNLQNNIAKYSTPQSKGLIKSIIGKVKNAGAVGVVLHALHVPWEVIAGLGLVKAGASVTSLIANKLMSQLLKNPRNVDILRRISSAKTVQEFSKQILRMSKALEELENQEQN